MGGNNHQTNRQSKKQNAENDGYPEECFFNPTSGSEHTPGIRTRQPAQSGTLALQDNADYQRD